MTIVNWRYGGMYWCMGDVWIYRGFTDVEGGVQMYGGHIDVLGTYRHPQSDTHTNMPDKPLHAYQLNELNISLVKAKFLHLKSLESN